MNILSAIKTVAFFTSRCHYSATPLSSLSRDLLNLLHFSITHSSLDLTQQCHSQILSLGFSQDPFLATKLISAYAICRVPVASNLVFNSLEVKSVCLWNSLINGYVKNQANSEAFSLFCQMYCGGVVLPDDYTLATVSKVCGEIGRLNAGKIIHGIGVKIGFVLDIVVANSLMSMYCKCGEFRESLKLFDEMPERSAGSWNVVIAGCVDSGNGNFSQEIIELIKDMQVDGFKPDAFTLSSLLTLWDNDIGKRDYGRQLHGFIVRNELSLGLGSDVHLGCCLIDMYSRINKVEKAMQLFNQLRRRNVYVWTAMINGYVQNGALEEALVLFRGMLVKDGVEPNKVTLVSLLPICSSLSGLPIGKQIHGYAIRQRLNYDTSLANALIDMYSKCGSLKYARRIFEDGSFCRDAISWSSIISGYGLHGKGEESVFIYDKMLQLGNKPDMITVVGVISACGRSGLVDEGLRIYNSAINEFGIKPTIEICACVVDMLGRSGLLALALDFIKTMPMEPGPSVWGALVSAAIMHGNLEMQDLAYGFLLRLEPENPSNYVSLSNLHASSSRWNVVAEVRTIMKERGLTKAPGCSWISINNTTYCFYATDKGHPLSNAIYEMLDGLILLMKGTTHFPSFQTDLEVNY